MHRLSVFTLLAAVAVSPVRATVPDTLLALAPAATTVLTSIDVTRTVASPFGLYVLDQMTTEDPHVKEFLALTGLYPQRDLSAMLLAAVAGKNGPDSRFALLSKGPFDAARVQQTVRAKGGIASSLNGFTVFVVHRPNSADIALAFPQPGIVALADLNTLTGILTPRPDTATETSAIDPQLLAQAQRIGPANDLWYATLLSGVYLARQFDPGALASALSKSDTLRSIQTSDGGMQFGSTVNMSLDLFTRSADDAHSVSQLLGAVGTLARLQNDPRSSIAAAALSNMQLETNQAAVHAKLDLTPQQLQQFLAAQPQAH